MYYIFILLKKKKNHDISMMHTRGKKNLDEAFYNRVTVSLSFMPLVGNVTCTRQICDHVLPK